MATPPLVGTKLFVPPLRSTFLSRPRVGERLDRGARLVLVSAPAGFGKTNALSAWVSRARESGRSVAWLSCESSEQRPAVFWSYVVAALQTADPALGATALSLLESPQPPVEVVLATLVNELTALPDGLDLVLDDYHLADNPDIAVGMQYLLEHLPPRVRVVIGTRVDPALPLARMRARGELLELRADELRFTVEEIAGYLRRATAVELEPDDVTALEQRTEGWIAALQLAALSMQDRPDPRAFITGFAGDDRYVVDYLVDEVLSRQPDDVRTFLLQTSVLDRLSGPLCDAATGRDDSRAVLESLERANLFVVPLDDTRRWYRYHHLFADVLQTHLRDERAEEVATLHRRASDWYHQAGEPSPAIRHALAGGDVARGADLVELAIASQRRERREATILGWLGDLPPDVVRSRPVLALGRVAALMAGNEYDTVPQLLDELELRLADRSQVTVVDEAEFARVPAGIELYRAALAMLAGDTGATHRHAHLAVDRAPAGDHVTRASAAALSGLADWGAGALESAHRSYTASLQGLERAGHLSDVLGCSITLAEIRLAQGRLGDAEATYARALALSAEQREPLRGHADMLVGLGQVALQRGDLERAARLVDEARALGASAGLPQHPYRWRVTLAWIREAQGDLAAAADLLAEAARVYNTDFNPDVRPMPALRARVLLALGRLPEALDWARGTGRSTDDEPSYLHECEDLALARVLMARSVANGAAADLDRAQDLLGRLLVAAEEGDRGGSVVEVLVVQALAHAASGDRNAASSALARALTLAESEGHVWVFVREGEPMRSLLRQLSGERPEWACPARLLAMWEALRHREVGRAEAVERAAAPSVTNAAGEPLSRREREILRLLATDLTGPEIARELVVSLNTVRTHTRNVYAKLGVSSRRAAVRRAAELGMLSGRP
jgi:LuxR family transcriptional regulator, maltose regulon positive regulatory protein